MKKFACAAAVVLALTGCAESVAPLTIDEACVKYEIAASAYKAANVSFDPTSSASATEAATAYERYAESLSEIAGGLKETDKLQSNQFALLSDGFTELSKAMGIYADGDITALESHNETIDGVIEQSKVVQGMCS